MKKPPAADAGDGLEDAGVLPVDQASIPACAMGLVIRMEGTDGAACRTGSRFALALEVRITLIEVEQREGWASRERAIVSVRSERKIPQESNLAVGLREAWRLLGGVSFQFRERLARGAHFRREHLQDIEGQ